MHRVGTVRHVGTHCSVVFPRVLCAGCDGRCGVTVGDGGELPLAVDLANGTTVEVVASARDLRRRALGVFGWPLGAVVAAAVAAEWFRIGDAMIVAALLGTIIAVAGCRARFEGVLVRRSAASHGSVRVVLGDRALD